MHVRTAQGDQQIEAHLETLYQQYVCQVGNFE